MSAVAIVVALVAAQRGAELCLAARNAKWLRRQGAVEAGRGHYKLLVALHAGWLVAMLAFVPAEAPVRWMPLAAFLACQVLRLWTIAALGRRWTTRILVLPGAPLVRSGPYRWLRHPNYLVVAGELALLPLAFGAWRLALVFSLLNLPLLAWRIRVETTALSGMIAGNGVAARAG